MRPGSGSGSGSPSLDLGVALGMRPGSGPGSGSPLLDLGVGLGMRPGSGPGSGSGPGLGSVLPLLAVVFCACEVWGMDQRAWAHRCILNEADCVW